MPTNGETRERTEEQILVQAPEEVVLGGRRYQIRPLTILEQREWREDFFKTFEDVVREVMGTVKPGPLAFLTFWRDDTDRLVKALQAGFLRFPERLADVFFTYAKDLNRAEVERTATERELVKAFVVVWRLAFPFLELVKDALTLARPLTSPASGKPTSAPSPSGGSPRTM